MPPLPPKMLSPINGSDQGYPAWAWPGGYPIFYLAADSGVLCPDCANNENGSEAHPENDDPAWKLIGCDIHWEGDPLVCDHCCTDIESAYGPLENE